MRTCLWSLLTFCCLVQVNSRVGAQDPAQALLDKAIAAHGGAVRLATFKAGRTKAQGTIYKQGNIAFAQETVYQLPNQIKSTETFAVNGRAVVVSTGWNDGQGWMTINGNFQDLDPKTLTELKEGAYLMTLTRLTALKDKNCQVSLCGEGMFVGRRAIGLKVVSAGHPDARLYFDRDTALLLVVERQTADPKSGKEVAEGRLFSEYRKINGIMTPKKAVIYRDGEKYLEAEMLEAQFLEKLDSSELAKP